MIYELICPYCKAQQDICECKASGPLRCNSAEAAAMWNTGVYLLIASQREPIGEKLNRAVLESIIARIDPAHAKLISLTEEQLDAEWIWQWDPNRGDLWNMHEFYVSLKSHERKARQWCEHHRGRAGVAGYVRDRYLAPLIARFLDSLRVYYAPYPAYAVRISAGVARFNQ